MSLTYKKAGVDISAGNAFVRQIRKHVKSTRRKGLLGNIGGFSGFFDVPAGMKSPVMVGATDGVGTKLLIANAHKKHDTVGIDLVAMCVNDLLACGAEPLFFLDYFATGKLDNRQAVQVVKGIANGCRQAGCAIIGGETAEMPDMYARGHYDLAGFAVGIVEKKGILTGSGVRSGDAIVGLHSNGLHSNGFSLARKVFIKRELAGKWGKELLKPTRIYVKPVLALHRRKQIQAIAHITGGGLYENINRSLPKNKDAIIQKGTWPVPGIFREIQKRGGVSEREMHRTFNMGVGMTLVVRPTHLKSVVGHLRRMKVRCSVMGRVVPGKNRVIVESVDT